MLTLVVVLVSLAVLGATVVVLWSAARAATAGSSSACRHGPTWAHKQYVTQTHAPRPPGDGG